MNNSVPVILSLMCACAWASALEALPRTIDERRRLFPTYTKTFHEEYEPYAVAAIPLNAAMPFVQLFSPGYRTEYEKPVRVRPQHKHRDSYKYDSSTADQTYEPYGHDTEQIEVISPQKYADTSPYDDEASSLVVYAQPHKHGGHSYRKHPSHPSHPSHYSPAPSPLSSFSTTRPRVLEPVIIRIHKYRVIH